MFVQKGTERFPRDRDVTRDDGYKMSGTIIQDIEEYRSICQSFGVTQPLLTNGAYMHGSPSMYFFNLNEAKQPLSNRYPGATLDQESLTLNLTLSRTLSEDAAVVVTALFQEIVQVDSTSGQVRALF